jgi:hypothetical protein
VPVVPEGPQAEQLVQDDEKAIFVLASLSKKHQPWFLDSTVERRVAPRSIEILFKSRKQ